MGRGHHARNKGAAAEREVAKIIMEWFPDLVVRRNLMQSMIGGHDLDGIPMVSLEVKRCEQIRIPLWWRQTERQAKEVSKLPLLCYRQNRKPWFFVLRREDYFRYLPSPTFHNDEKIVDGKTLVIIGPQGAKEWLSDLLSEEGLE